MNDARAAAAVDLLASSAEREPFRAALLGHYDREARRLPWREESDPYRILVSEIMLQQTRVETVKGYYGAWLERFPTLDALAEASEDDVLEAWAGLGYYRRARNLHSVARVVREEAAGRLPERSEALRALPGVGEYTAGAVASIAFGERVPAVDGNVRRVLSRLFDVASPSATWLRDVAGRLVDADRPGDWNQALMELGATVCTPGSPRCEACPVSSWCSSLRAGTVDERPRPKKRKDPRVASIVLALMHRGGRVLLEKRPDGGLLGGMWALPESLLGDEDRAPAGGGRPTRGGAGTDADGGQSAAAEPLAREIALARELAEARGLSAVGAPDVLPGVRHLFSHLDALYLPIALEVAPGSDMPSGPRGRDDADSPRSAWVAPEAAGLALPVAQRKVLDAWRRTDASGGSTYTEAK